MNLSVIIPAFNEAGALPGTLQSIRSHLSQLPLENWEVVVVDDGSTDGTAAAAVGERVKLVRLPRNVGKGAALVAGANAAAGEWMLLMDADSSTAIAELEKLRAAAGVADIAFGSRAVAGASISRHQPWYREAAGKAGNLLIRALLLPGVYDSQCGFKLVGPRAVPVLRTVRTQRWGFDVELLAMARAQNLTLAEVPVTWRHDPSSAVGVGSYLRTLGEVGRIWWRVKVRAISDQPSAANKN